MISLGECPLSGADRCGKTGSALVASRLVYAGFCLAKLRQRYDEAAAYGITHNRLRDWDGDGNHPGYALGCWLRD
jgi:hypothetical protein